MDPSDSPSSSPVDLVKERYPLHYAVWVNDTAHLESLLTSSTQLTKETLERSDPHGRTPLALAITLDRKDCAAKLIHAGADATAKSPLGFALVKEAVSTADPALVKQLLIAKKQQTALKLRTRVPELLRLLETTGDFYVEMHWEFSSWVPLLSRMCPSDTYKIWKKGASVRIDTTLVGFEDMKWIRGNLSFIFKATGEAGSMNGILYQINHDNQAIIFDEIHAGNSPSVDDIGAEIESNITDDVVDALMAAPISSTELAADRIDFARLKSGLWGFQSEKAEVVNSYESKVYSVNKVELVTRQRTEHLPAELRDQVKQKGTLASLMKFASAQTEDDVAKGLDDADGDGDESGPAKSLTPVGPVPPPAVTLEEYFLFSNSALSPEAASLEQDGAEDAAAEHSSGGGGNDSNDNNDENDDDDEESTGLRGAGGAGAKYSRLGTSRNSSSNLTSSSAATGNPGSSSSSSSSLLSLSSWKSGAKRLISGVSSAATSALMSVAGSSTGTDTPPVPSSSSYQQLASSSAASASSAAKKLSTDCIGRPLVMTEQVQKFKATAWMCESFPLSLQQQVLPIIDLMAPNNAHFAKLRDFIQLRLPPGFPVKIEIPLFRVVSAQISFLNCSKDPIATSLFDIPQHYHARLADGFSGTVEVTLPSAISGAAAAKRSSSRGRGRARGAQLGDAMLDDDMMMQMVLQESLAEVTQGGRSTAATFGTASDEDFDLQRALLASMMESSGSSPEDIAAALAAMDEERRGSAPKLQAPSASTTATTPAGATAQQESDLEYALRISAQELSAESERERREQEELEMVLKLSMEQK